MKESSALTLCGLAFLPLGIWAEQMLWNHMAPKLGLPHLSYWDMACIDIFIGLLRMKMYRNVRVIE